MKPIEAMAEAMWQEESIRARGAPRLIPWEDESPDAKEAWRRSANAAFDALMRTRLSVKLVDQNGGPVGFAYRTLAAMLTEEASKDANGTVWQRPTADAYMRVCVALHAKRKELEAILNASGTGNGWLPIEAAPRNLERCFLWCADRDWNGKPRGTIAGRIVDGAAYGDGMNGPFYFSHWRPGFPAPEGS